MKRMGFLLTLPVLLLMCLTPGFAQTQADRGNSLDQGGTYCGAATVIPGATTDYTDTGFLDNDDDCSNPQPWPYNDVFYTFTPSITRTYIFSATAFAPSTNVAMRIKSGACCAGGTVVAGTTNMVPADCDSGHTTYLRANMVAGTQYWIHVGDNSPMPRDSRYTFRMMYVACPDSESSIPHNTIQTAQEITLNDSLIGDSADTGHPKWFKFTLDTPDSVIITELGRSFGHCNSGFFPTCDINPLNAHFVVYCDTFGHALVDANGELCSSDAEARLCLQPGTYYIKVENYGFGIWNGWGFILITRTIPTLGCPPLPEICGQEEQLLCPPDYDSLVTISPTDYPFPHEQHREVCIRLDTTHVTTMVVPVLNATNFPTVTIAEACSTCRNLNCEALVGQWIYNPQAWVFHDNPPRFENTVIAVAGASGCCVCASLEFILPVEVTTFTAVAGDGEVTLRWVTASENNNDHFELARDGVLAASVTGAGTSTAEHTYRVVDSGLENYRQYSYSLIAVDANGTRTVQGTLTAVPAAAPSVVTEYALHQNYPNPFNPTTSIGFDLPEAGMVSLIIYNLIGQEVSRLIDGPIAAGRHVATFNAASLPSGIYIYHFTAGTFTADKKMLLIK